MRRLAILALVLGFAAGYGSIIYAGDVETLLSGDLVIRQDGVYTRVYHYYHPAKRQEVTLIGTLHTGDRSYFGEIETILGSCHEVVYEDKGEPVPTYGEYREASERFERIIADDDVKRAFERILFQHLTYEALESLDLLLEQKTIRMRSWWKPGDREWYRNLENDPDHKFFKELRVRIAKIPAEIKLESVKRVRELLWRGRNGFLTRREYAEFLQWFFGGKRMEAFSGVFDLATRARDETAFRVFDKIERTNYWGKICVEFGAYHMKFQKRLLEERGYTLVGSEELKAISFP